MKALLQVVRWFVGLLFIFSGLIKANDPLGLSYKMQEFFEVWGWHAFHDYTLFLSIVMNVFEVLAGVAIIIGWKTRLFSWLLLLLIIFFTFLTGYALFSTKIKTCGCFGDCLPLLPVHSFLKDLLLLVLTLVLFKNHEKIKPLCSPAASALALVLTVGFTIAAQWYVLRYLPVVDCLPYKKGNNLLEKMKAPAGAVPDSFAITFKYRKAGKDVEFSVDSLPEDIDTYEYVDRYDKLVRKGNAVPPIEDFTLMTASGADTAQALLNQPGTWVMILAQNFKEWPKADAGVKQVINAANAQGVPVVVATPAPADAGRYLAGAKLTVVGCDATVVKTAARVVPTLFLMKGANILEKKSYRQAGTFIKQIKP
ncbi:BT_3928 family protein [Filimonas effusa]|uniref:DoxX family membrane protein n=1 Tax=Filimonas effusa TaxID=2508721 RepID=A0A4Q1D8P7_9BACT|nr:BT_3928 family protein [Filimonas effusa]RXK85580.1 DoxX family membrane protein [Filimonas effusa]